MKARILNSGRRNIGSATRCSMRAKATSRATPPAETAEHERARPAHGRAAVGLDAVGDADHDPDEARGRR